MIILAPPLLPFPFDAIPILILKQLSPKSVPKIGFIFNYSISTFSSDLSDGYFFINLLACFSNTAIVLTL